MRNDKRKTGRKALERKAWIDQGGGSPELDCAIGNMSETGAKLLFTSPPKLSAEFVLRLSRDGRVARKCRLAWTSDNEVGVEFVARLTPVPAA